MIRELLAVGIGGGIGSIARYLLSHGALAGCAFMGFPAGTFVVNAVGSLLIGILLETLDSATAHWLLIAGFCGGFTTFSAFSADTVRLLKEGAYGSAALYMGLSVVVCIAFTAAGMWGAHQLKN